MGKANKNLRRLSETIANTLSRFESEIDEPIKILALDFHSWDEFLALAILTQAEFNDDPLLDDPAEMAAWKHYDLGADLAEWDVGSSFGNMKTHYDETKDTETLFRCCATAIASPNVQQVLERYQLADGFRISVANPDDGQEFFTPEAV